MRSSPHSCSRHSTPFLIWLLILGIGYCHAAYIVTVPPKEEECFHVSPGNAEGILFGNYDMLDDSKSAKPLSVVIFDSAKNRILYRSISGAREGNFKVKLSLGQRVNVCVQNGLKSISKRKTPISKSHDDLERVVGLKFSFEKQNDLVELHNQNAKVVSAALSLNRELGKLQDHHGYMKVREAVHRETVEHTFSRLLGWTLLEGGTVVAVAVGQIMYFRRFLEQRRYI